MPSHLIRKVSLITKTDREEGYLDQRTQAERNVNLIRAENPGKNKVSLIREPR